MIERDYSLYLVTDQGLSLGRSNEEVVEAAIKGGVSCVQLREKKCTTREFIAQARALKKLLKPSKVPLIINDRVDVALVAQADGIHLGQNDMSLVDARRILGSKSIIGISAETLEQAVAAQDQGADYIGISPVFPTSTKTDTATPLGLQGIKILRQHISLPLVGIGGINAENATEVILAGADGIAVVSAIVTARFPERAARELLFKIRAIKSPSDASC